MGHTHEKMDLYCKEIQKWEFNFYGIEYIHVVRDRNQAADALSKIGSSRAQIPQGVFVQDIHAPSVGTDLVEKQPNAAMLIDDTNPTTGGHDWRTAFINYILDRSGFQDKTENERLIRWSKNYILVDGKLRRKNASSKVLLKCISQYDGVKLLDDIHAGSCGNHAASRTLIGKAFRAGFYWPTTVADDRNWSDTVKDASSSPRGPTCLLTRSKLFRCPGLSPTWVLT